MKKIFNISVQGRLHFKHFLFWFGHLSLGSKFEQDLMSGYRDIQLFALVNLSFPTQTDTQTLK